ncbi:hypothetical protein [Pseudoroseicyclus tamaricis]|uniref:17 kDa surface antigen n=1 Tax=Pseudoroseicyclus tamaricis TaxID=2705421 RepID=A0A6B2JXK2_9RHOB|nr:hypothetical protein [Pseudoroseicyclus tamaricis]NDV01004.1 hypothetical protein [Pseudoroseicyclus tamaricis]
MLKMLKVTVIAAAGAGAVAGCAYDTTRTSGADCAAIGAGLYAGSQMLNGADAREAVGAGLLGAGAGAVANAAGAC